MNETILHRTIRAIIQKRNQHTTHQPQYIPRRIITFEELQSDIARVEQLSKECIELNRRAVLRHREEVARLEAEMNARMERDRTAAAAAPQQQPEVQALSNEQVYAIAQDPVKWQQLMEKVEPQLKHLIR